MKSRRAFMFGYGIHSAFVANELKKSNFQLSIVVNESESYNRAIKDGYINVFTLDITDDNELQKLNIQIDTYLICMMSDNHLNVFLTLSLHHLFPKSTIIALSNSLHATQKLKMAGASVVVDTYKVSANRIHNIIQKPIATKLMDSLLSTQSTLSLREIEIPKESFLDKTMVDDFDFNRHKIILVGMIDRRLSDKFMFVTTGLEHRLDIGDMLVCIGYNRDLDKFKGYIKRRKVRR